MGRVLGRGPLPRPRVKSESKEVGKTLRGKETVGVSQGPPSGECLRKRRAVVALLAPPPQGEERDLRKRYVRLESLEPRLFGGSEARKGMDFGGDPSEDLG